MAPQTPRRVQQVKMGQPRGGRRDAGQDEAVLEDRHVESAAVERDQAVELGQAICQRFDHCGLVAGVTQEVLAHAEAFRSEEAQPHDESHRPGAAGKSGRLSIEEADSLQIHVAQRRFLRHSCDGLRGQLEECRERKVAVNVTRWVGPVGDEAPPM